MKDTTDTLRWLIYGSDDGLNGRLGKDWVMAHLKLMLLD